MLGKGTACRAAGSTEYGRGKLDPELWLDPEGRELNSTASYIWKRGILARETWIELGPAVARPAPRRRANEEMGPDALGD